MLTSKTTGRMNVGMCYFTDKRRVVSVTRKICLQYEIINSDKSPKSLGKVSETLPDLLGTRNEWGGAQTGLGKRESDEDRSV